MNLNVNKPTPELLKAAKQAASEIFRDSRESFDEIKKRPWYKSLLNSVTFQQNNKKVVVRNIRDLAGLQSVFIEAYTQELKNEDADLDKMMEQIFSTQEFASKIYRSCVLHLEHQRDLGDLFEEDQQILLLFINEFNRTQCIVPEEIENLQQYNRGILKKLSINPPMGDLEPDQLEKLQSSTAPEQFYRCALEQCAVTGRLEPLSIPYNVSELIKYLDISEKKKGNILSAVKTETNNYGKLFFLEKYDSPQPLFQEDMFELADENEASDVHGEEEETDKGCILDSGKADDVLNLLALNRDQHEWMLNLKVFMVRTDVDSETAPAKKKTKADWLSQWLAKERNYFRQTFSSEFKCYFNPSDSITHYNHTEELEILSASALKLLEKYGGDDAWFYLALMEAELFEPYYPLDPEAKKQNKEFSSLKFCSGDYTVEIIFCVIGRGPEDFLRRVDKTYKAAISRMEGKYGKIAIGALSAVAITAVTAATAGALAGPIAVALVGGKFTLAGAALTNASLALLGGGAIAAGGAGVAGGVATVVGGGALLGFAVGGSASAAVTGLLLATPQMTLKMAAKLETSIREIVLNVQNDIDSAQKILERYKEELIETKHLIITLEAKDTGDDKSVKAQIKALKKSAEYMDNSIAFLSKFISSYKIGQKESKA